MPNSDLDKFFNDYLEKEPLFIDKKVLQANYTPENIPHREEQINHLASILAPSLRLEKPSNIFLYGKTGCISGDSLVYTNKGYVKIKDIDENSNVLSFNTKTKQYEWSPFIFLRFNNQSILLKITLENGYELTVTKDHPLLDNNLNWKKADELGLDEQLITAYDVPNITKNEIPLALARLLGFTISDGSLNQRIRHTKDSKGYNYLSNRQRYRYFSIEPELLGQVKEDIKQLFPQYTPKLNIDKGKCPYIQVISQEVCQTLNQHQIPFGKKSDIVEIPKIILESSNIIQREFIKALFSGDGTVSQHTYQIEYYSNSKKLLQQISFLLHQEGIACKIRKKMAKCNGKTFKSYRLYISGQENLLKFNYKIGFYSQLKQQRMNNLLKRYKCNMKKLNQNHLAYKITKIEEVYEPFVYDLTVPKNHNFIANGMISHNTGKTLSTKHVLDKILSISKKKDIPIESFYLNCKLKRVADTEYRLISQLARAFGREVPVTGLPTDEIYKIFLESIDKEKKLIILILDEIDQLVRKAGDEILYNLTRINSELKNVEIAIIGISNDLLFTDELDPRVKSSLSEEELVFPPYNALQLQDILRERSKKAFREEFLEPGVVEKCAAYAAREHGDARRALELLRVAGELAERKNDTKLTTAHIDYAEDKIERDRVLDIVHTQPKQFQLALLAMFDLSDKSEKLSTGDVFTTYKTYCKKVGLKPLTQRRVSDIISELDMLGIITARVISKGRYGRTREITLGIPNSSVPSLKEAMKEALNL
tara:strand:- start:53 stop:2350 length:2298 start_codon:yes stop_codon:yes gene_type:complete